MKYSDFLKAGETVDDLDDVAFEVSAFASTGKKRVLRNAVAPTGIFDGIAKMKKARRYAPVRSCIDG